MKKKIQIGSKEVMLTADGYTPVKYRDAFPGRDIIRELIEVEELEDVMETDLGLYERLAYVMSDAVENGVEFEDWLKQFGPLDIFGASVQIMSVWNGSTESQSESGEEDEEPKK